MPIPISVDHVAALTDGVEVDLVAVGVRAGRFDDDAPGLDAHVATIAGFEGKVAQTLLATTDAGLRLGRRARPARSVRAARGVRSGRGASITCGGRRARLRPGGQDAQRLRLHLRVQPLRLALAGGGQRDEGRQPAARERVEAEVGQQQQRDQPAHRQPAFAQRRH